MTLTVSPAAATDLADAEARMRGVLEQDLGSYHPRHADLDDLTAAYRDGPRCSRFTCVPFEIDVDELCAEEGR